MTIAHKSIIAICLTVITVATGMLIVEFIKFGV